MIFKLMIPKLSWNVLESILAISLAMNILLIFAVIAPMKEKLPIINNTSQTESTSMGPDEYLFIEQNVHTHVEIIEGRYHYEVIDSPTYSFDEKTGTLRGMINFDVNDTLKVVYGGGLSLSGVGGGKDTMLYGVYELPYQHYELIILYLDIDGTVHLRYRNVSITLKSGEEWVNTSSRIDVQQFGNERSIANLTMTDRIMNHGILHKSTIERWW